MPPPPHVQFEGSASLHFHPLGVQAAGRRESLSFVFLFQSVLNAPGTAGSLPLTAAVTRYQPELESAGGAEGMPFQAGWAQTGAYFVLLGQPLYPLPLGGKAKVGPLCV